ncbi:hypothetical protein MFFDBJGM_03491 [Pectobacterium versatile]|nr:hypothetical protein MFFDBJGM_03491 [Pectobacterium versatile]
MPASQVCHKFFSQSLNSLHQYRKNALLDMTVALTRGASLSLTSIGTGCVKTRFLHYLRAIPGQGRKIFLILTVFAVICM